jgi:hypothetical protein
MELDDRFDPTMPNDLEQTLQGTLSSLDRGLNYIKIRVNKNNTVKMIKVPVYTSGGCGSKIRDAETGQYYAYKVGSKDENLFFKVVFATGECTSPNGSSTAFYTSPYHYMHHMKTTVSETLIEKWNLAKNKRLKEKETTINYNQYSSSH